MSEIEKIYQCVFDKESPDEISLLFTLGKSSPTQLEPKEGTGVPFWLL